MQRRNNVKSRKTFERKTASATVTIIITAVVFLVYISSAYTDILHLKKMHEKYYTDIQNLYDMEYNYIESLL